VVEHPDLTPLHRPGTSQIDGHRTKYVRVERERTFLVLALPPDRPAVRARQVVDRYFEGTGLRLRQMTDVAGGEPLHVFKLTQKIPEEGRPGRGLITNTYLSEKEYELLAGLRGPELRKTRYSIPPMAVDVFAAPLDGLILAEAEFVTDEEMAEFVPPDYVDAEVTSDARFAGGELVRATHQQVIALLAGVVLEADRPQNLEIERERPLDVPHRQIDVVDSPCRHPSSKTGLQPYNPESAGAASDVGACDCRYDDAVPVTQAARRGLPSHSRRMPRLLHLGRPRGMDIPRLVDDAPSAVDPQHG
jgi:hypothetical protein